MKEKIYTHVHLDEAMYTCGLDVPKARMHIHALSRKERRVHVGEFGFGPWYLDHGILVLVHGIWFEMTTPGIGSMVLFLHGFGPWY